MQRGDDRRGGLGRKPQRPWRRSSRATRDKLADKHGIDGPAVVAKLRGMSFPELVAAADDGAKGSARK
jgi:hypothetical protein